MEHSIRLNPYSRKLFDYKIGELRNFRFVLRFLELNNHKILIFLKNSAHYIQLFVKKITKEKYKIRKAEFLININ